MKKVECPSCLGTKQYMVGKSTRGFEYIDCKLCNATGEVLIDIANDYELSLNEDLLIEDEEF